MAQGSEAERLLEGFLGAVPHAIVVCDTTGTVVQVNAQATTLLGYAPAEIVGLSIETLVPSRMRSHHAAVRGGFAESNGVRMLASGRELLALRKDGTEIPVIIGIATWHTPGGPRVIASLIDNSARRRAEADAEAQHRAAVEEGELAQSIINEASIGIILYDAESGKCVSANARAAMITGLNHEQLLDQRFREIESWQRSGMRSCAERTLATRTTTRCEAEIVTSGGRAVVIECEFLAVTRRDRPHLVLMMEDLTERRNLEAQLRVAQKMEAIAQLAGGVAHDFNNLLTVIGTYSNLLLDEMPADDPRRADLEEIYGASTRAATLTRQLLAFGRRQLLDIRLINLNESVEGLEKMLRRVISAEIALEISLDPTLGAIHADPGQIEQALMNLVVNARDAMPGGGRIGVQTANVEVVPTPTEMPPAEGPIVPVRMTMLRVSDTGSGMSTETLAHIFEPFYTTKAPGRGTGLGLSTTYGIVKQSGGFIRVRSTPGEGTSFELYFPRVATGAVSTIPTPITADDAPGTGHVLVVEDDEHVRRIVVSSLRERGYDVTESSDGEAALELTNSWREPPDILVTDVIMPRLNGRELASRLRERWPRLPVLFTSAYAPDEPVSDPAGDVHGTLLRKPFLPSELGAAVRDVLSRSAQ